MTAALLTEGLIGGSSTDANPPAVAAVTPSTNTPPGAAGGMPADYFSAKSTPIVVSITDADGAGDLKLVQVTAVFLDGSAETVFRAGNFVGGYVLPSYQESVTNGIRLHIEREASWPAASAGGNLAVGLVIDAADGGGNVTTASLFYEMPTAVLSSPPAVQVAAGVIDQVQAALDRLPAQFRS